MLDWLSILHFLCHMNKLPFAKRIQIVQLLVQGNSLRATSRIADVSINTVTKLLIDIGTACQEFHHMTVVNIKSHLIQCDEIWSFACAKTGNVEAMMAFDGNRDVWTWTGIDVDTNLIVSWFVGNRDAESAFEFMQATKGRIASHVQLISDGYKSFLKAVDDTLKGEIDNALLVEIYGSFGSIGDDEQYSSAESTGNKKVIIKARPDEKHYSTSFVESLNQTTRTHERRFNSLNNSFSNKIEHYCHAISLHFVYYNFCKVHRMLRVTPAMQAGLVSQPMTIQQLVEFVD